MRITTLLVVCAAAMSAPAADPVDTSFLKRYAETRGFLLGRPVKPKITPDGQTVLFLRSEATVPKQKLFAFDVATGKTTELLAPETLLKGGDENLTAEEKARRERQRVTVGGFADYHFDETGNRILVTLAGRVFVFDRTTKAVRELKAGKGTIVDPKWSPDGKLVSYVRDHDVYAYDLATDKELAVTTGGTAVKTHGLAEFVAQEEMKRHTGYWWSPDSKKIAYTEADHAGVEVWSIADPFKPDVKPPEQFYPRPGKKNVSVRLGIIDVPAADRSDRPTKTTWVEWTSEAPGKATVEELRAIGAGGQEYLFERYEYLSRVAWLKTSLLSVLQSRDQKRIAFAHFDRETGKIKDTRQTYSEEGWINAPSELLVYESLDQVCVAQGLGGESTGISTLGSGVHYSGEAELLGITDGSKEAIIAVRTKSPEQHVFRVSLEKAGVPPEEQITTDPGVHTAAVGKKKDILVVTSTALASMPRSVVRTGANQKAGELPSVAVEPPFKPNVTVQQVGDFWTAVVRPRNLDKSKKYPVIVDVYGGPRHLHVVQAMRNWLIPQWLADQGFVVVAVDNRGTPGRGRDWERAVYQKFGTVPLEDQAKGLAALCDKFPELDRDRVGIVGWSFGGYMAANAVLRRPDVFKAAVAGAPVTDWEDYDTHYTERYLGLLPESKAAYDEASLLPLAKNLSRPLLLVHGTADDNVYYRHTLKLADAIFRAGKECEVLPLPGVTHLYTSDPEVTERLWARSVGFFKRHLGEPK